MFGYKENLPVLVKVSRLGRQGENSNSEYYKFHLYLFGTTL